jgi:membrane protein
MAAAWRVLKQAFNDFFEDDAMTLAGAVSYYAALSLAPLVVLALWALSLAGPGAQQALTDQMVQIMGQQAASGLKGIMAAAQGKPIAANVAGIISLVVLVISASSVFAQLQHSLNVVWDVQAKPGQGLKGFIRKKTVAVAVVFALLALLVGSMGLSAVLQAAARQMGGESGALAWVWQAVDLVAVTGVMTLLFGVLFRYVPDVTILWRDVWLGAAVTAVLFVAAKFALGMYLGRSGTTSAYGAAGSLIAVLIWVFYSAAVLFFGAELTQAWAKVHGREIEPDPHAIRIETGSRAIGSSRREAGRQAKQEERERGDGELQALPREEEKRAWEAGNKSRG